MNADDHGLIDLMKRANQIDSRGCRTDGQRSAISVYLRSSAVALFFLLASVAHAQRQAQLPWWDRSPAQQIGAYWIKSDLPAAQVEAIGRHLNMVRGEFDAALAGVPVRVQERLDVYVFAKRDEWAFTLRTQFAINPPEHGGFIVTPSEYCLAFFTEGLSARAVDQVVQREGFRQFAHNRFERDLPLWLNEGLADLFGEATVVENSLVFGQSTPRMLDELKDAVAKGKHIPFSVMLNISLDDWAAQRQAMKGEFIWHQSRMMALFVMQAPQAYAVYLRHLNSGLPHDHAMFRAFGMEAATMESHWKQYVAKAQPSAFATALERIEFLAQGLEQLHQHKVAPESITSLRQALRGIDFKMTMHSLHGTYEMSAADDAPFEIPKDASTNQQPLFLLSKTRPSGNTQRERELERANPAPPSISTQHLRPANFRIQWLRGENGAFSHQITTR